LLYIKALVVHQSDFLHQTALPKKEKIRKEKRISLEQAAACSAGFFFRPLFLFL